MKNITVRELVNRCRMSTALPLTYTVTGPHYKNYDIDITDYFSDISIPTETELTLFLLQYRGYRFTFVERDMYGGYSLVAYILEE